MQQEVRPSSPERTRLALIGGGLAIFIAAAIATVIIMNRGNQPDGVTPLPPGDGAGQLEAGSPTASAAPPSAPVDATAAEPPTITPEPPYEYVIQEGDTLLYILQIHGYQTLDVVPAVLSLNGLSSENQLVSGTTLLIPRQTATPAPTPNPDEPTGTPIPPGVTVSAAACATAAEAGSPESRVETCSGGTTYWLHEVSEGQTIASIAFSYDSHVPCILSANGFSQNPVIFEGQQIKVCILSTLTPSPTPTGDPLNSTSTPTPTLAPPLLMSPGNGASFGRNDTITLRWVATRPLNATQRYLVIVQDFENNRDYRVVTTSNALTLPNDLRPGIGQAATYEWRVVVLNGDTTESPMISGLGEPFSFTWGG